MSLIVIRGGHNNQSQGASGIVNEVVEDRKIYLSVIKWLKIAGEKVIDGTPGNMDSNHDLRYGTDIANKSNADLFVSIHLNKCYDKFEGPLGSEVWINTNNSKSACIARQTLSNLEKLGFKNRGAKDGKNRGLHDIVATKCSSAIIECFFCESVADVKIYNKVGHEAIGKAIAEGIVGKHIAVEKTGTSNIETKTKNENLKAFQHALNLDGIKDNENHSLTEDNIIGPKTTWVINNKVLLNTFSKGYVVQWLQNNLIGLGFNCGPYGADGDFGNSTLNALKSFQKSRKLESDGICGPKTINSILNI